MTRETLPNRRRSERSSFAFDNRTYEMSVGCYDDGRPAEVFVDSFIDEKGRNFNTTPLAMIARDFAVVLSIALQFGTPLETLRHAVTRLGAGEPASVAGAVLDAIAREGMP